MTEYKGYLIKPAKNSPSIYAVVTAGQGGKIPAALDSLFTTTGLAMAEIDRYLEAKGKRNGKASSEGGDQ